MSGLTLKPPPEKQPPPPTWFRSGPLGTHGPKLPFGRQLRELFAPLRAYYIFVFITILIFTVMIIIDDSGSSDLPYVLAGLWISTFVGVFVGQCLAIWRIRSWVVAVGTVVWWLMATAIGVSIAGHGDIFGVILILVMTMTPFFVWGGLFSLRIKRAFPATWVPLMYGVVSTIILLEERRRIMAWHAGNKWAIWDLATFLILGLTICLLVSYLVVREKHRLVRWQAAPGALLRGSLKETGKGRPRLTVGGWVLLVVGGLMLTLGTAFAAPYLWRTGPGDRRDDDPGGDSDTDGDRSQDPIDTDDPWGDIGEALQAAVQAMVEAARSYWPLLILLVLLLAAIIGTWRPAYRAMALGYLKKPPWRLPATRRIENSWRIVEIALGDLSYHREPKETATALCQRTLEELPDMEPAIRERLLGAAATRDRILFSLGVGPQDESNILTDALFLYPRLRAQLQPGDRFKTLYRRI